MLTLTRPGAGTARDAVSSLKSKDPRREKPAVAETHESGRTASFPRSLWYNQYGYVLY